MPVTWAFAESPNRIWESPGGLGLWGATGAASLVVPLQASPTDGGCSDPERLRVLLVNDNLYDDNVWVCTYVWIWIRRSKCLI